MSNIPGASTRELLCSRIFGDIEAIPRYYITTVTSELK
jgi:hypothetical protein